MSVTPNYNESYLAAKLRKAATKFGLTSTPSTSSRIPVGQVLTTNFPVLDLGVRPDLDIHNLQIRISGKVKNPQVIDYHKFMDLPKVDLIKDFHCVTRWSKLDIKWRGVLFSEIVKLAQPLEDAKFVIFGSRDGYTTNVSMAECLEFEALIAYELDGSPIPLMHGGPVRALVPNLYGWKSAKFLDEIKFTDQNVPGFWETRGYNMHGDPWKQERYS